MKEISSALRPEARPLHRCRLRFNNHNPSHGSTPRQVTRPTDTTRPVTPCNESEILNALVGAFTSLLENFPASADALQQRIDQGEFASGTNAWVEAVVSIEEQ
ncbi:hypothetical protein BC937DRAFT_93258 [Endogone sp. FLAS-F59071]|nr:hypothetical protein BC937DRAFT_93258 [Endogone sp. FLAS-F59071]|eukprot:RUS21235.1 hypothetical protein BC937DRAFT_93258 [Endogone sp. FLAS-F59071]